jgi:hypothetical protein
MKKILIASSVAIVGLVFFYWVVDGKGGHTVLDGQENVSREAGGIKEEAGQKSDWRLITKDSAMMESLEPSNGSESSQVHVDPSSTVENQDHASVQVNVDNMAPEPGQVIKYDDMSAPRFLRKDSMALEGGKNVVYDPMTPRDAVEFEGELLKQR